MAQNIKTLKYLRPLTPGQRGSRLIKNDNLLSCSPLKNQVKGFQRAFGRSQGKIISWHRGGGHKRCWRQLFWVNQSVTEFVNLGLEYDPNRKAKIARLFHPDFAKYKYILAVKNIKKGQYLDNLSLKDGNHQELRRIRVGSLVHNLSSTAKKQAQYLRSAGTFGQVVQKSSRFARIKLRSGEHKYFPLNAFASLGVVHGEDTKLTKTGKAGRNRWLGWRPSVRGVAINPVDHPHGGGEGRTSGGQSSVTPWGKPTKGQQGKKSNNPLIIRSSKQKKL